MKPRKESRTIALPGNRDRGNGLDYGRWFRCWHCGFICKLGRDSLGSPFSGSNPLDYVVKEDPFAWAADVRNAGLTVQCVADLPVGTVVALTGVSGEFGEAGFGTTDAAFPNPGIPVGIRHSFMSDVNAGCPLCGSTNWRGDI